MGVWARTSSFSIAIKKGPRMRCRPGPRSAPFSPDVTRLPQDGQENGTSPRISTPVAHLPGVLERLMKIFWRRCCSLSCCLHGRRDTATGQNDRAGSCRPLPALCQPTGERAPSTSAASSGAPSVSAPSISAPSVSAPSVSATSVAPRWSQKWLGVREHLREHLGFVPTVVWQTMCGIRQARGGMSRVSPACIAVGFLSFVTF